MCCAGQDTGLAGKSDGLGVVHCMLIRGYHSRLADVSKPAQATGFLNTAIDA
jgi:hypothetical protein